MIKRVLDFLGIIKISRFVYLHSPYHFIRALVSKYAYHELYKKAQIAYKGSRKIDATLDMNGIKTISSIIEISIEDLKRIDLEFENPSSIIQFDYTLGRYGVGGIDSGSSNYTYLSGDILRNLGIVHKVYNSKAIANLVAHLKCNLRVSFATIFKVKANQFVEQGSFIFHRDSYPVNTFKLIVYLSDVSDEGDGEFSYIKGSHKSYNGLPQFGNSRNESISSKHLTTIYGKVGDAVLFNVNGYHRGGRCINKDRIVLVVSLTPSIRGCNGASDLKFKSIGESEYEIFP